MRILIFFLKGSHATETGYKFSYIISLATYLTQLFLGWLSLYNSFKSTPDIFFKRLNRSRRDKEPSFQILRELNHLINLLLLP